MTTGHVEHVTCRELLLLSMTVSMGMLIFAGLGYALEKDEPDTMFYTLPQTLYWAIITMTSTGYGDIAPTTAPGKLVASFCCICGTLCITLPIPIIVANFNRSVRKFRTANNELLGSRGYQKSIIEMELEEQRRGQGMLWQQTKESILEARGILSSSNSLAGRPELRGWSVS